MHILVYFCKLLYYLLYIELRAKRAAAEGGLAVYRHINKKDVFTQHFNTKMR